MELTKGQRVSGSDRKKLAKDLKMRYEGGASIRELAGDLSRSYGFVHRMLKDEGAKLRGRGGATRKSTSNGKASTAGRNGAAKKPAATKSTAKKSTAKKVTTAKKSAGKRPK